MKILDGKKCSANLKEHLAQMVQDLNIRPSLHIIRVGEDAASTVYVHNKYRACIDYGCGCTIHHFGSDVAEHVVAQRIKMLNNNPEVHGIMLQLPIPKHLDEHYLVNLISPDKDVDGLTDVNVGKLTHGVSDAIISATPLGILRLLQFYNIDVAGKNVTIVGRSNIVGRPLAALMTNENATVTLCHSNTENLMEHTKTADILVVAIGKAGFLTGDMVKPGATVIDVGINRDADGKLCGDADFDSVVEKASYITPVPGGVGPMTVAALLENVVDCAILNMRKNSEFF